MEVTIRNNTNRRHRGIKLPSEIPDGRPSGTEAGEVTVRRMTPDDWAKYGPPATPATTHEPGTPHVTRQDLLRALKACGYDAGLVVLARYLKLKTESVAATAQRERISKIREEVARMRRFNWRMVLPANGGIAPNKPALVVQDDGLGLNTAAVRMLLELAGQTEGPLQYDLFVNDSPKAVGVKPVPNGHFKSSLLSGVKGAKFGGKATVAKVGLPKGTYTLVQEDGMLVAEVGVAE